MKRLLRALFSWRHNYCFKHGQNYKGEYPLFGGLYCRACFQERIERDRSKWDRKQARKESLRRWLSK